MTPLSGVESPMQQTPNTEKRLASVMDDAPRHIALCHSIDPPARETAPIAADAIITRHGLWRRAGISAARISYNSAADARPLGSGSPI